MTNRRSTTLALTALLTGCPSPAVSPDATVDRPDASPADTSSDPSADRPRDVLAEAPDAAMDAPIDAARDALDASLDALPDRALDAGAEVSTDGGRDVLYATDLPSYDAPPPRMPCTPGERRPCTCVTGAAGAYVCHTNQRFGLCTCEGVSADGGVLPALPPRLRSPLSDSRVTSQRPTLRWVLPDGVTRARVTVCEDRPCTRELARAEVEGSSWRSPTPLTPGVRWWRVQGLSDAGAVVWTSATWSFAVGRRDAPNDTALGPIHDFNADGYADIAAGAEYRFNQIHVYLGGREGMEPRPVAVLTTPHPPQTGPIPNYSYGDWAAVGDLNGDGYSDLAVAEQSYPAGGPASVQRGHIHVYLGAADGIRVDRQQVVEIPHRVPESISLVFPGTFGIVDYNGDGYGDLIATRAIFSDRSVPQVVILLGSSSGLDAEGWRGLVAPDVWIAEGPVTRGVGDVDADGYGDVVVSAPGGGADNRGVIVLHGNPTARADARISQMTNVEPLTLGSFYELGNAIAGNDFNGDGYGDIAASSYGSTVILRGSPEGLEPDPVRITPTFGISTFDTTYVLGSRMSVQGDLNGDGLGDLVMASSCDWDIARPLATCWSTNAYFYVGTRAGVPNRAVTWILGEDIPHYGIEATAVPGDVNGDGYEDFVGGAPGFSDTLGFDGYVGALKVFWGGPVLGWSEPDQIVRSTAIVRMGFRLY